MCSKCSIFAAELCHNIRAETENFHHVLLACLKTSSFPTETVIPHQLGV